MTGKRAPSESVRRASQLNTKIRLHNIVPVAIHAQRYDVDDEPQRGYKLEAQAVEWMRYQNAVGAQFGVSVELFRGPEAQRVLLAKLEVAFRVFYALATPFSPEDEAFVPDYLRSAGWLHAWPYLRAEVQRLSSSLGLPALVLPVLLAGQMGDIAVMRVAAGDLTTVTPAAPPVKKKRPARAKAHP